MFRLGKCFDARQHLLSLSLFSPFPSPFCLLPFLLPTRFFIYSISIFLTQVAPSNRRQKSIVIREKNKNKSTSTYATLHLTQNTQTKALIRCETDKTKKNKIERNMLFTTYANKMCKYKYLIPS